MINIINKLKQFFKNIFLGSKAKRLSTSKEHNPVENDFKISEEKNELNNQKRKKEFFEIYNNIKKGQYNLNELTEEQSQKIITMLKSEISLKKDKLNHNNINLSILKADNRINEKKRILELYNEVKKGNISLDDIYKNDLLPEMDITEKE